MYAASVILIIAIPTVERVAIINFCHSMLTFWMGDGTVYDRIMGCGVIVTLFWFPALVYIVWARVFLYYENLPILTILLCVLLILGNILLPISLVDRVDYRHVYVFYLFEYDYVLKHIFIRSDVVVYISVLLFSFKKKMRPGAGYVLICHFVIFLAVIFNMLKYFLLVLS